MQWDEDQRQAFLKHLCSWISDEAETWLDERPIPADIESPIEAAFEMAIAAGDAISRLVNRTYFFWLSPCLRQHVVHARGQQYRVDFAFIGEGYKVAVELDGHDWHERTPEQVERRNVRDANLQSNGWTVLHFSGRQILRDPFDALCRVESTILDLAAAAQRLS